MTSRQMSSISRVGLIFFIINQAFAGKPEPAYRTDTSDDPKLEWFQLQDGEFPPEDAAHYFAGELIGIDPINRMGVLRPDRTDKQSRSHWDRSVHFELLPYATVRYRGTYAEIRDIPIGTHLHGLFFKRDPKKPRLTLPGAYGRIHIEADFSRCLQLEDDFSYYDRQKQAWRIDNIDFENKKLEATLVHLGKDGQTNPASEKTSSFDLLPYSQIFQGDRIVNQRALAKGQVVQLNLTWATLYGPGRVTSIWIDGKAREIATQQQLAIHHQYIREYGLPGWIDSVENYKHLVDVTLFNNVDPQLFEALALNEDTSLLVAEPTLRTYDQVNDRKRGPILKKSEVQKHTGSSGLQVQIKPDLLLEGYRPKRIVRIIPGSWGLISIPFEHRLWP